MARQHSTTSRIRACMIAMAAVMLSSVVLVLPVAKADVDVIRDPVQLRDLLAGRTVYGRFLSGDSFTEYYSPDGKTAYLQLQCLHAGRWWIERLVVDFGIFEAGTPIVCFRYQDLNPDDPPSCFAVGGATGAEVFYGLDGAPEYSGIPTARAERWAEGNAEPLSLDGNGCPAV